jgi:hypothetical protein
MSEYPNIPLRYRTMGAISALLSGTRFGRAFDTFFVNRYEASMPGSPRRTWLPAFTRDARYDATPYARWEMDRKIRYFERNSWLVKKIGDQFEKYTVGPFGLQVMPASSDSEWNKRMTDAYGEWCEHPCIDSLRHMSGVHKLIARSFDLDGEIFILKTREKKGGRQSVPRVQLVESHRCSTPGFGSSDGNVADWIDGVKVDENGKPIAYALRDDRDGNVWTSRPADSVIHIFEPPRVGMWRAVTPYHAVLNTLHDLDDLGMWEMEQAKERAMIAVVMQTWNGEADPNTTRRERFLTTGGGPSSPNNPPDEELQKRISQYKTVLGSRTLYTRPGEDVKFNKNDSPSAAQQWYYRYLISQICGARGVPMMLVFPESLHGTIGRAVLDDANLYFKSKWQLFALGAQEMYLYFATWAKDNIRSLNDPPGDWQKTHVAQPRACNVDIGRNSAAMLAEWAAGATSLQVIAGGLGMTRETLLRQKAEDVRLIKDLAVEFQCEPAEISAPLAEIIQQLALANQAQALADSANAEEEIEKEPVEA